MHTSLSGVLADHLLPTQCRWQLCLPDHLPVDFDCPNLSWDPPSNVDFPWWYGARSTWGDYWLYGQDTAVAQSVHHELLFDVSRYSEISSVSCTRRMFSVSSFQLTSHSRYLICLTIAPAFITASIYLCLSRIVTVYGPQHSRLAPRSYTYIFIGCDLFALVLQGAGGGIASTARTHAGSVSGAHVMVAGLAWQVVSMTLFLALWADFAIRVHKARAQGYLKTGQDDSFAVLRDSKSFRLLQVGKSCPAFGKFH